MMTRIWLCAASMALATPARATYDAGVETELVGLLGTEQQAALLYLHSVHPEAFFSEARFVVVSMKDAGGRIERVVSVDESDARARLGPVLASVAERRRRGEISLALGDELERRVLFAYFLEATSARPAPFGRQLFAAPPLRVRETFDELEQRFQLPGGASLVIRPKIVVEVDSMKLFDSEHNLACVDDGGAPTCSNCARVDVRERVLAQLQTSLLAQLTNGRRFGYFLAGPWVDTADSYFACTGSSGTTASGSICTCRQRAILMAPEVTLMGRHVLGVPFLQDIRSERFQVIPACIGPWPHGDELVRLAGVQSVINAAGDLLLFGSYLSEPGLNSVYYPAIAVVPQALPASDPVPVQRSIPPYPLPALDARLPQ